MNLKFNHRRWLVGVFLSLLAVLAFFIWASADIDSGVYVNCFCKGSGDRRCVSLTFDDGPDENMTPKVLDVLKKYNIKATFFLIGKKAEKNPAIVKRIVNEGHIIGGHSWSHSCDFPLQSPETIYNELYRCEELLYDLTGKRILLFRPPFGVTNPLVAEAVNVKKCNCVGWSIRSFDTNDCEDRVSVCKRITRKLHNGGIILLHDRCDNADQLLEMLISDLLCKDYDIINLDEMLYINPYQMDI